MWRQFALFTLAGGIATGAHYSILVILVHGGWGPVAATSCGALCGALINYGLNRRYTFRSRRSHGEALPRYLSAATGGLLINAAVVAMLVGARVHYLAAQAVATGLMLAWSYFVNRWWTFRGEGYAR